MTATQKPTINAPDWTPADEQCEEPSGPKKESGWNVEHEKPARKHFNWLFKSLSAFFTWLTSMEDEYYIDADAGDDDDTGADGHALKTVAAALAKVRPGIKTTIHLKAAQTHHIDSNIDLSFPNLEFKKYGMGNTPMLNFCTDTNGNLNVIFGIGTENGYVKIGDIALRIDDAASGTFPWSDTYRHCFRMKGNSHGLLDGCYIAAGDASTGNGKPSVFGAQKSSHVSVAVANLPAEAITLNGKGYVLDLGGIPAAGGDNLCHSCGSLSVDATSEDKIDNPNCWVIGNTDYTITPEEWTVQFNAEPSTGTFDLLFGGPIATAQVAVEGIDYDETAENIEAAIVSAFDTAGWTVTATVEELVGVGGGIVLLNISLDCTTEGMPTVYADITSLTGPTASLAWMKTAYKAQKNMNFVTNIEI